MFILFCHINVYFNMIIVITDLYNHFLKFLFSDVKILLETSYVVVPEDLLEIQLLVAAEAPVNVSQIPTVHQPQAVWILNAKIRVKETIFVEKMQFVQRLTIGSYVVVQLTQMEIP